MSSVRKKESTTSYFGLKKAQNDKVNILSKHGNASSTNMQELLTDLLEDVPCAALSKDYVSLDIFEEHLDAELDNLDKQTPSTVWCSDGRLGNEQVVLEKIGSMGSLMIEPDQLELTSRSNFSTIRANSCVFQGKWMYECMLGSKGIMQLGWSTAECKFSQEEGVGDTPHSYAYDGNRLRSWNVKSYSYGQAWLVGDVIGLLIDCDVGTVTFYRNGTSMGEAFRGLNLGPGYAYFPAISLSLGENVRVNFGATAFQYPVEGYQPLEHSSFTDMNKAKFLIGYWKRLLPHWMKNLRGKDATGCKEDTPEPTSATTTTTGSAATATCSSTTTATAACSSSSAAVVSPVMSKSACLYLVTNTVIHRLAPLLKKDCITDSCVLPMFVQYCELCTHEQAHTHIHTTLHVLWSLLQPHELASYFEALILSLLSAFRFCTVDTTFAKQLTYLRVLHHLITHQKTCHFLLSNVLFDRVKFPLFFYIKSPDDESLKQLVPTVWWSTTNNIDQHDCVDEDNEQRRVYLEACQKMHDTVAVIEELQVETLKVLISTSSYNKHASNRTVFLQKCREFLRDHMLLHHKIQLAVVSGFFYALTRAVRYYTDQWYDTHMDHAQPSHALYIPGQWFSSSTLQYFKQNRLGGAITQLRKKLRTESTSSQGSVPSSSPSNRSSLSANIEEFFTRFSFGGASTSSGRSGGDDDDGDKSEPGSAGVAGADGGGTDQECYLPTEDSLVELMDDLVLLYHLGVHKHLNKMCGLRDTLVDYAKALVETEQKLQVCPDDMSDVKEELIQARDVFENKACEQARQMCWVIGVVFSKDKQEDVFWILELTLNTILHAYEGDPKWFLFVPDLYVETCVWCYSAILHFYHPTTSKDTLQRFPEVLHRYAEFLVNNFNNERIQSSDTREAITQSLACFVCYPQSLRALETLPEDSCTTLVKTLLSFYEGCSWVHTNSIIVRIWKGCGFGFRYKHLPDVIPVRHLHTEISLAKLQDACPSMVLQHHITQVLRSDRDSAVKLLDTILNQLNWTFSECCGYLQKLRDRCLLRPDITNSTALIDNHHISLVATCFYTAVSFLRLIEMVAHLCPELLTDWSRGASELLLCRLFQCLTQILNRMTMKSNVFHAVSTLNLSGLETVSHFPILTGVAGILIQLILHGDPKSQQCATAALLDEPGFQISYLEYLLGCNAATSTSAKVTTTTCRATAPPTGVNVEEGERHTDASAGAAAASEEEGPPSHADEMAGAVGGAVGGENVDCIEGNDDANDDDDDDDDRPPVVPPFSFRDYSEINEEEIQQMEMLIVFLKSQMEDANKKHIDLDDESLCEICYARQKSALFHPCKHQSCRSCISHHMLTHTTCFFCKAPIKSVIDTTPDGKPK